MNKKLVTLAVAAALVAPAAVMADATMYGILHQSIDYFDVKRTDFQKEVDGVTGVKTNTFKGWALNRGQAGQGAPRSNRIGIKGSEDLGGGLKAIYQVELGITTADQQGTINDGDKGVVSMRNSFVGLAGNWGTFLVGRHDTPLKISTGKLDLFSDTMADYNGTVGFNDIRADNAIAYISPSWSGFQIAAAVVPGGGGTVSGYNNIDSDGFAEGWSLAAIYKNGPWYASAAYESLGKELGTNQVTVSEGSNGDLFADTSAVSATNSLAPVSGYVPVTDADGNTIGYEAAPGVTVATTAVNDEDWNKWRIGLGILDWNGFYLTGIYENWSNGPDSIGVFADGNDRNLWQVQAGYAFGNNMVKAMYGQMDRDIDDNRDTVGDLVGDFNSVDDIRDRFNDADRSTWAIAFDHNFSKRTKAYVVYTDVDDDGLEPDWTGFSLGIVHKF